MFHILRVTAPCPVLMYCSLFWSSAQVSQYARWQTIFYKEKRDFIFLFINISSGLDQVYHCQPVRPTSWLKLYIVKIWCFIIFLNTPTSQSKVTSDQRFPFFFIFQDCFCSVRTKYGHRSYRLGIYFYFWQGQRASQPVYQIHLQRSYKRV